MIAKRSIILGALSALLMGGVSLAASAPHQIQNSDTFNYRPPNGVIPDAETAIQVAMTILSPIYGKDVIADEKPFKAKLHGDVWTVQGTFNHPGWNGGVAVIEIEKSDGRVKRISHGM